MMRGGGNAKAMRDMQARLMKMQEELAAELIETTAGGGAVTVVVNGQQRVQSIRIDPGAVDPDDVELLQDMLVIAVNEALTESQEMAAKRLSAFTGGMLPF